MDNTNGEGRVTGIVVYDLATLRFRRSSRKTSMSVVAASGEVLAVVDTLAIDSNEDAAYAACEHALSAGRVRRAGRYLKIGLYNPYSGEVSYKAAPDSIVFGCERPISIEALGSCGEVVRDEELRIEGSVLPRREVGVVQASRAWEASGEARG